MILGDKALRIRIANQKIVHPIFEDSVQPASVDLHIDCVWRVPIDTNPVDPRNEQKYELVRLEHMLLKPGGFVLGATVETVKIPRDLKGTIDGKSSLGRLGLFVHITAGNMDPGFEGVPTLEIYNCRRVPILLRAGMPICHISFAEVTEVEKPYGHPDLNSKYQGQKDAEGSKFHLNRTRP